MTKAVQLLGSAKQIGYPEDHFSKKLEQQTRTEQQWEKEAEHGTVKVRNVVNVILPPARRVGTIPQIHGAKKETWNGNGDEHDVYAHGWVEQDGGKQYGSHCTRCADAGEARVVLVPEISGSRSGRYGQQIKAEVSKPAKSLSKESEKPGFYLIAKKVQSQHIEKQVSPIGVQQASGNPPEILIAALFGVGPVF